MYSEPDNGFLHPVEPIPPLGLADVAPDFHAMLRERVQRRNERGNRPPGNIGVFPVVATAVMMALLRARE